MSLTRSRALALLSKCVGNEIWSVATCQEAGVPEDWIEDLADAYESGFRLDRQTIYVGEARTNQFHGVRDIDLAIRLAETLGVNAQRACEFATNPVAVVEAIKIAVIDGD